MNTTIENEHPQTLTSPQSLTPQSAPTLYSVRNGEPFTASPLVPPHLYGAREIKAYLPKATVRGFAIALTSSLLLLGGYTAFLASTTALKKRGPAINKMKLTTLPPPPQAAEATPPPPPTSAPGPAARAGTPVPVPDALVAPDVKDFANVDEISRASTSGGDGDDQGFLGLASDVDVEVREAEPNAYEFMAVDKEPYIDIADLQKRVVYPDIARRAGIEGTVNIRVLVDKKGKPKKYIIESTDSDLLNKAAIDAVMSSTFTPAIQGTTPLDCWVSIPMNFRMK
ncbi:MAG: energy transducer TonB [Candidatus Kapaibacterium sp.]|nr:MAG: energy transducer TonB [Candidatus Kapabacteria bacterium]